MLHEPEQATNSSALIDTSSIYGWVSILLHWLTGVLVIVVWIIGKSILDSGSMEIDARRALHISIAASAWLLILVRIAWRFRSGHPRVHGLTDRTHNIAKMAHYLMLLLLLALLISGPIMVWADGHAVVIFGAVSIPGPVGESESLREIAWTVHSRAALGLLLLFFLHVAGALKHLMFHSDDTIIRILWPTRPGEQGPAE